MKILIFAWSILGAVLLPACSFAANTQEARAIEIAKGYKNAKNENIETLVRRAIGEVEGVAEIELLWKSYKVTGPEFVVGCDLANKYGPDSSDSDFYFNAKWQWWVNLDSGRVLPKTEVAGDLLGNLKTLHLKDGTMISGDVIKTDSTMVWFSATQGTLVIPKEDIVNIDYQSSSVYVLGSEGQPEKKQVKARVYREPIRETFEIMGGRRGDSQEVEGGWWGELGIGGSRNLLSAKAPVSMQGYVVYGASSLHNKVATLSKGKINSDYGLFRVRASYPSKQRFKSYFDLGAGYYWFKHTLDSDVEALLASYNLKAKEEIRGTLGWTIGAGIRYEISDSAGISFGLSKHFIRTKCEVELRNIVTRAVSRTTVPINLDWYSLNMGVFIRYNLFNPD